MARMKAVVNCETGEETIIPYTPEEEAQADALASQEAERITAFEAETERVAALRASAKAKLIAGTPLTEDEASVLVI
jgi:hypothetical protein